MDMSEVDSIEVNFDESYDINEVHRMMSSIIRSARIAFICREASSVSAVCGRLFQSILILNLKFLMKFFLQKSGFTRLLIHRKTVKFFHKKRTRISAGP